MNVCPESASYALQVTENDAVNASFFQNYSREKLQPNCYLFTLKNITDKSMVGAFARSLEDKKMRFLSRFY